MAKRHAKQVKKDAVAYVHDHADLSVSACARNLGVNVNTLHGWIKKSQK